MGLFGDLLDNVLEHVWSLESWVRRSLLRKLAYAKPSKINYLDSKTTVTPAQNGYE